MTRRFNTPTYPPRGKWDPRLSGPACEDLGRPEMLHENAWFRLCNRGGYYTVEYRAAHVVVLPIVEKHSVIFVRVKRPVIADSPLEFPAGGGDPSEEPEAIAARELQEETGILVRDLRRFEALPPMAISSTRMPKLAYVFRVELSREEFNQRGAHDDEIDAVECVSLADAARRLVSGEIYVSIPAAVLGRHLAGLIPGPLGKL